MGGASRNRHSLPDRDAGSSAEAFLEMMAAERGASLNTIEAYGRDLEEFAQFVAARGTRIEGATADQVRDYLRKRTRTGIASVTMARKLSVLRGYFAFLLGEGVRRDDPCAAIDTPRFGRRLPKTLSQDEIERILAIARDRDDADGRRLRALAVSYTHLTLPTILLV